MAAGLVEFDLSSITGIGVTINQATLSVYEYIVGSSGATFGVYRIIDEWDEMTVLWSNRPSWTGSQDSVTCDGATGWWDFNITQLVQDWVDETEENHGVSIFYPSSGCTFPHIYSSDYGTEEFRPKLEIDYTPPSGLEPASWGEIKADNR